MKKIISLIHVIMLLSLSTTSALAEQDVQITGKIQQPLPRPAASSRTMLKASGVPSSVTLLKIELSDNAWLKLETRLEHIENVPSAALSMSSSQSAQLGMNKVPVLNHCQHGSH